MENSASGAGLRARVGAGPIGHASVQICARDQAGMLRVNGRKDVEWQATRERGNSGDRAPADDRAGGASKRMVLVTRPKGSCQE